MMIPVKIGANLSATGIEGVRWVLVDAAEIAPPALPADRADAGTAAEEPEAAGRPRGWLWLLKLVLLIAGVAGAWLTTQATIADHAPSPRITLPAPPALAAAQPALKPDVEPTARLAAVAVDTGAASTAASASPASR